MTQTNLINISNLTWGYDNSPSLTFHHFDFYLNKGEFVVLSWKSGSWKSSLIKILLGQELVPWKSVYHRWEDISKYTYDDMQQYRRQIGVVFQDYKLLEWLTAKENVLYPLHIAQLDAETIQLKYDYIVNLFKLYKYIDDPVKFLSGWYKQKIAIARALINNPEFVMADEPTGNLDWEDTKHIADTFLNLHNNWVTILLVTHDVHLIEYMKLKWNIRVVTL